MSSTLYYIVNNVLYHQCCIILSMLHYFINAALHYRITLPHFLHYQWWTTSLTTPNINDAFCHQGFITVSVLHCITNAGLNIYSTPSSTMCYTHVKAAWEIGIYVLKNSTTQCKVAYANFFEALTPYYSLSGTATKTARGSGFVGRNCFEWSFMTKFTSLLQTMPYCRFLKPLAGKLFSWYWLWIDLLTKEHMYCIE